MICLEVMLRQAYLVKIYLNFTRCASNNIASNYVTSQKNIFKILFSIMHDSEDQLEFEGHILNLLIHNCSC